MKIRRATEADSAKISALFDQYRIYYRQPSDPASALAFISERLRKMESVLFVAETDTDSVGFVQLYPSFSSVSMKKLWILNDLFVSPGARKLGAGKLLLEAAVAFAKETGAKGLNLTTAVDNTAAQRLYEACGWKREDQYFAYKFIF